MKIGLAFRSFFALLFQGDLSDEILRDLGLTRLKSSEPKKSSTVAAAAPALTAPGPGDGAMQVLGILQRDSRIIDFLMEDISSYDDEQVGAAVREMHRTCRESLDRYLKLEPVIDGVEGTAVKLAGMDPASIKLLGNVPPQPPSSGMLRHKGWKCRTVDLPAINPKMKTSVLQPAEVEIE